MSSDWEFKLWVCTVEYPGRYSRSLVMDCRTLLDKVGNWCEVADLNIVRLSSVSGFTGATKGRVGKLSGIVDPVFGLLDGYGAYFQNLYATRNVNIAGTLTAGDEHGFSSTFYVAGYIKMSCRTAFLVHSPVHAGRRGFPGRYRSLHVG